MTVITNLTDSPLAFGAKLEAGPMGRVLIAQFNRPADTLAYAAEDVISDSTSVAKAIAFKGCGEQGLIHGASLLTSDTVNSAVNYTLLVFNSEPTNYADNAGLSLQPADAAKLLFAYRFNNNFGLGTFLYYRQLEASINFAPVAYTTNIGCLYGLLVTNSAITTSVSAATYTIKLYVEAI